MDRTMQPIAVFDLDGTLADTAPDLIGTLNAILALESLPPLDIEQARDLIGAGAKALIARGLSVSGRVYDQTRLDELFHAFLAHYSQHLCVDTKLFPGVIDALSQFEAAGYRLAICTNKIERHASDLMERLGIAHRFSAICGRDSFPFHKPDPRHLWETIKKANGFAEQSIMIGDSVTDIDTARAARIPVIAVSFGYTQIPVHDLKPDIVIDHFKDCFAAAEQLLKNSAIQDRRNDEPK
jgi:phosphoglycolate phosphatase